MLGLSLIAKFLLAMNGPSGVITCSRGSPEVSTGSFPFKVRESVENNMLPIPPIVRFFLRMREISEGTSYQMVRLVFRHFRNEPSPEIPLTLPFKCACVCVGVVCGCCAVCVCCAVCCVLCAVCCVL